MALRVPPPPLFDGNVESILSDTKKILEKSQAVQEHVILRVSPEVATFDNSFRVLLEDENHRLFERRLLEFYSSVSPDEAIRAASHAAAESFAQFDRETVKRKDLFDLFIAVQRNSAEMSSEPKQILETYLLDARKNAFGLSEKDQSRRDQIKVELEALQEEYLDRCDEYHEFFATEKELEGVDANLFQDAERTSDGKLRVSLEQLHWDIMTTAHSHETRRRAYITYANYHCDNVPLLEKTIMLRHEKAKLLGFPSHGHLRMAGMVEESPVNVQTYLGDILSHLEPSRDALIARWRAMKRNDLSSREESDDEKFYAWDRAYYTRKLVATEYMFTSDTVREYFELNETITRMLQTFEQVMSLRFTEVSDRERDSTWTWHRDVRMFTVRDDQALDKDFLGFLYMDMTVRQGKRPGASAHLIRPGFIDSQGRRQYVATSLICNFKESTRTKPCLLEHSQVVLLFHELGHAIHDLVAKTEYARFHGATCGDFNEAPSQMLEEWCWYPQTLRLLSCHYSHISTDYMDMWRNSLDSARAPSQVPRELPEETIEKMCRSKQAERINRCLALLDPSLFDMAISGEDISQDAKVPSDLQTTQLYHATKCKVFGVDMPAPLPPAQAFNRTYYTIDGLYVYLATQLYALDMFNSVFKSDPMNREQGLRYRRTILEKGGSRRPLDMMEDLLGRAPNAAAFYQELGINHASDTA